MEGKAVMATVQLRDGSVQVDDAVVMLRPASGFLKCSKDPNDNFCKHVEEAIVSHADAALIAPLDTELSGTKISVPLVPKHKQWADVYVGEFHVATESYYLWLRDETPSTNEHFIGFLQKGEGRAVIRSMVYDWFRSNVSLPMMKCNSTSHRFKQEQVWMQHTGMDASASDQFAEYWSVWKTKMCLMCNVGLDFSDIVPGSDTESGWKKWS